jgi:hypothetical protein
MALLFMDGFDHYASSYIGRKWTSVTGTMQIEQTGGRRGRGALRIAQSNSGVTKHLGGNYASLVQGAAYKIPLLPTSSGGGQEIFGFRDGATIQIYLYIEQTGKLSVYRGSTLLGQSANPLLINAWTYIECKATFHPSAGSFEVRVDGAVVASASGVNTSNSGNAYANTIGTGTGTNDSDAYYDDWYVCDTAGAVNNDFLGDVRIEPLYPNADGTYQQFTHSVNGRAARYWRVYIYTTSNGNTPTISELEMRTTPGGANQCTGGTAIASGGSAASNAFDGNTGTSWPGNVSSGSWIGYDFGAGVQKEITEIALRNGSGSLSPIEFAVDYSDDGLTYYRAWMITSYSVWPANEQRVFTRPANRHFVAAEGNFINPTSYLSSTTAGHKETFALQDLDATGNIAAVQVSNLVAKADAGNATVRNILKQGATEIAGPAQACSTTATFCRTLHETAPDGSAWTLAALNGLEVGLEITG